LRFYAASAESGSQNQWISSNLTAGIVDLRRNLTQKRPFLALKTDPSAAT